MIESSAVTISTSLERHADLRCLKRRGRCRKRSGKVVGGWIPIQRACRGVTQFSWSCVYRSRKSVEDRYSQRVGACGQLVC